MKPFYYLAITAITATAAAKKPELPPYNDPADQLIRMAPMTKSSRSVVVNLSPELHLAFDTQQLRTHTVWKGGGVNLFGPCYHGAKRPFICQPNGERLWGNPPVPMWSKASKKRSCSQQAVINSSPTFRHSAHAVAEPLFCTNWAMSPKYNNQSTHQTVPLSGVFD